jgi:RNA polymerase sigma-54 factor
MKLAQTQIQIQRQIMAPVMQQSIEILMLPLLDLEQAIHQELETNPLLEVDELKVLEQNKISDENKLTQALVKELSILSGAPSSFTYHQQYEDEPEEIPVKFHESLEEKLLHQLHIDLNDPVKIAIGEMIIGQLDEDGYLTLGLEEIARILNIDSIETVEEVLRLVQSYEPIGVAARDLKECLLIQSSFRFNGSAPLINSIITGHLEDLGRKRYDLIAKKLKVPMDHIRHCAKLISELEPRPARNHRPVACGTYVQPDLFIHRNPRVPDEFVLEVNEKNVLP